MIAKVILMLALIGYASSECDLGKAAGECTEYMTKLAKVPQDDVKKVCKVILPMFKCYDDAGCLDKMPKELKEQVSDKCGCAYAVPSFALMTLLLVLLRANN